jgi:hypothetical protein
LIVSASLQTLPFVRARTRTRAAGPGWFVPAVLASCLFLQRFGIPFGALSINVVGPVGLVCAAIGLATGRLALHQGRLIVFGLLLTCILVGSAINGGTPDAFAASSPYSTLQFVAITSFAVLSFAEPMSERGFFGIVTRLLLIIAVAGILQFVLQFAGLRVFSFTHYLPEWMLDESNWNLAIPIGFGEALKSNGFFLVEPSVMSQFMAMALMIEMLAFRRLPYLLTFLAGFALSFSGTGWIVLLVFIAVVAIRLGGRGVAVAVGMIAIVALAAGTLMVVSPQAATVAAGRIHEIQTPGTSGHMRFITPFWMLDDELKRDPALAVFGIGGGVSEHLVLPYAYDVNTPVKIGVEFGFPALACYLLLFLIGARSRLQSVLVVPGFVLLTITGGYQQFAPVVFFVSLICSVARLRPDSAD